MRCLGFWSIGSGLDPSTQANRPSDHDNLLQELWAALNHSTTIRFLMLTLTVAMELGRLFDLREVPNLRSLRLALAWLANLSNLCPSSLRYQKRHHPGGVNSVIECRRFTYTTWGSWGCRVVQLVVMMGSQREKIANYFQRQGSW